MLPFELNVENKIVMIWSTITGSVPRNIKKSPCLKI